MGGPATGWVDSGAYEGRITLATALAISAAAVNSQSGSLLPRPLTSLLALFNWRLGVWFPTPRFSVNAESAQRLTFSPTAPMRDFLRRNDERDPEVFLSDGGHHDNLGLTALVDRSCETIVALDATADASFKFKDFNQVRQLLEEDGWNVEKLDAGAFNNARSAAAAEARRVPLAVQRLLLKKAGRTVKLFYAKACLTEGMTGDAFEFAVTHRKFPQESTGWQWFSEDQFGAYVAVGATLAAQVAQMLQIDANASTERVHR